MIKRDYSTSLSHCSAKTMLSNVGRRFLSTVKPVRPFNILGVQQIAVGGLDKSVLSKFWVDQLGLKKTGTYRAEV